MLSILNFCPNPRGNFQLRYAVKLQGNILRRTTNPYTSRIEFRGEPSVNVSLLLMTKEKRQIDNSEASASNFNKLQKQNFHLSQKDKVASDDFCLDSDSLQMRFNDFEFQADAIQLRRDIEGLLVGYSRDLYEQFQLLKMTDFDSHCNAETGNGISVQVSITVLQQKSNATIN